MAKSKICLTVFYVLCISLSYQHDASQSAKNGVVRHKKKLIAVKKPSMRNHHDRPGRQSSFAHNAGADDYPVTSEPSGASWKPITYSVFSEGPHSEGSKPTEVSATVNGNVGHISHNTEQPQAVRDDDQNADQDYTLLQYYIPFEQIISHSKPITETPVDTPKETISFEKLNKAAVEPVAVFRKENEAESHSENDNEFTGRYEYEYFVQDDHWGTNFGHKEYRDGKHTKGDYEVVLPDGRVQHVKYWSDASGYHASVTYHPLFQKFKHV